MLVRFRAAGTWRLKVYVAASARREGKVRQETVAYLGSIDIRHLGPSPDEARERASVLARQAFWNAANPKLRNLANRAGGEDGVKRLRLMVHARIPFPLAAERARLDVLDAVAEAEEWHRIYRLTQDLIAGQEELAATITKKVDNLRAEAKRAIDQANFWQREAAERRKRQA
jgi:hypothetical protein